MTVRINPQKLPGEWKEGFALDIQTTKTVFVGHTAGGRAIFDSTRSEIGNLLYLAKYGRDETVVANIVEAAQSFLEAWAPPVQLVVPIPPSNIDRGFQPVISVSQQLCERMKIPFCTDCVLKLRRTPERKNFVNSSDWMNQLESALTVDANKIAGKSVLLFDDLYQSGATATVITRKLIADGAASVYFLAISRARKLYTWGV